MQLSDSSSQITNDARKILRSSSAAVAADRLVQKQLSLRDQSLQIGANVYDLGDHQEILIVGAGKVSGQMAQPIVSLLSQGDAKHFRGWINVPDTPDLPSLSPVSVCAARPLGANQPTEEVLFGTWEILRMLQSADPRALGIVLISGGGSALLESPRMPLTLLDIAQISFELSQAGFSIQEINLVRRQLSQVKGGGLVRSFNGAKIHALIVSDVIGNTLADIASGPTVGCHPQYQEAHQVVLQLQERTGGANSEAVKKVIKFLEAEPPEAHLEKQDEVSVVNQIIGDNSMAVEVAKQQAKKMGYRVLATAEQIDPNANVLQLAQQYAIQIESLLHQDSPVCLITGGEPTLQVPSSCGKGGRNQHLVLAVLQYLKQRAPADSVSKLGINATHDFCFLSAGTDGEDGNTSVAGAYIDSAILERSNEEEIARALQQFDSHNFFKQHELLLKPTESKTNVCDIHIALIRPRTASHH